MHDPIDPDNRDELDAMKDAWQRDDAYECLPGPVGARRHVLRAQDWVGFKVRPIVEQHPTEALERLVGYELVPDSARYAPQGLLARRLGQGLDDRLAQQFVQELEQSLPGEEVAPQASAPRAGGADGPEDRLARALAEQMASRPQRNRPAPKRARKSQRRKNSRRR